MKSVGSARAAWRLADKVNGYSRFEVMWTLTFWAERHLQRHAQRRGR